MNSRVDPFELLRKKVVGPGLCTHCGTCVGLSGGTLEMMETDHGPIPVRCVGGNPGEELPEQAWDVCPGRGVPYPDLFQSNFGQHPANWLLGPVHGTFTGHSRDPLIRRSAASGGVITQTLVHLLRTGRVDGAVVVTQGLEQPWAATTRIARSEAEIIESAQSVYVPVPVNTILEQMEGFPGRLAYVGLPDQVAALRMLQARGHAGASKVDWVIGPYVGTGLYKEALETHLRSHGVDGFEQVAELRYREGEWPGNLYVRTVDGREIRVKKFYYNYLIPFFVTRSSLLTMDFSNELTDISVGDAWHPNYESQGGGHSVVLARTARATELLEEMRQEGALALAAIDEAHALSMHGHMIDLKKRGTYIRCQFRRWRGRSAPSFGYRPRDIHLSRYVVEFVLAMIFGIGGTRAARFAVRFVPLSILGPVFDLLRRSWKGLSKQTKRRGLGAVGFELEEPGQSTRRRGEVSP